MKKRRQKNPYDFFDKDIYKWIYHEMQSMIEDIHFIERFQKILRRELQVNKKFTYDQRTNVLPVWSPENKEINSYSLKTGNKESKCFIESERLIDIIEGDDDIAVTVEIPEVEKNDIDLYITEDSLEITSDSTFLKYHKMLKLPCEVIKETAKATYRNGVLDVVINKRKQIEKIGSFIKK